jgi:hypothetical protein
VVTFFFLNMTPFLYSLDLTSRLILCLSLTFAYVGVMSVGEYRHQGCVLLMTGAERTFYFGPQSPGLCA